MFRRVVLALFVILCVAGPPMTSVIAAPDTATTTDAEVFERTLVLEQRPETPGEFGTDVRFSIPDRVSELTVELEPTASLEDAAGFDHVSGTTYEWDGTTDDPRLTFTMPANRTEFDHYNNSVEGSRDRNEINSEGYYFVETGSWGLVSVPEMGLRWTRVGEKPVSTARSVSVDGPGAAGDDIAFFGDVTEYTRTAHGEQFRLVVPTAASLEASPTAILDSLEAASGRLDIGGRTETIVIVAAPTGDVEWASNGAQHGENDAWIVDDAELAEPQNAWVHEYVHTRQAFSEHGTQVTPESRWLIEAQAEYEATLLALEQERISIEAFRAVLTAGTEFPYDESVLTDPSTWESRRTPYAKGPLVLGVLDGEIRLATDGERTIRDVFRELNHRDGPVTESAFLDAVERAGGEDSRESAAQYIQTADAPDPWSAAEYQTAFDHEPAPVEYSLATEVGVSGPYRNGTVDEPLTVLTGETVTLTVAVENQGRTSSPYTATLTADGHAVDSRDGRLAAGERVTEQLEWTPTDPGRVELRVADQLVTVAVRPPAAVSVADLTVESRRVTTGDTPTVVATVENNHNRPAETTVAVRSPEGVVTEELVTLPPGETATVETTVSFEEPGRYQLAAGDQEAILRVDRAPIDALPGFSVLATVVAIALCLIVGATRVR